MNAEKIPDVGFTLVEDDKIRIRYIYDHEPYYNINDNAIVFHKNPIACVVSNGTRYGISIRNTKIVFNKKKKKDELIDKSFSKYRARHIATERMYIGSTIHIPNKMINVYTGGVPSLYNNKILCPYKRVSLLEAITYTVEKMIK